MRAEAGELRPLALAGARGTAGELARALGAGGDAGAIRNLSGGRLSSADLGGVSVLVYAVAEGAPDAADEAALRVAERAGVRTVCVVAGAGTSVPPVPYVLAADVVPVAPGGSVPLERIAERVAAAGGGSVAALAAALPALRPAVCRETVQRFSRANGLIGAAVFVPGVDLPVLALNQVRMVLRIAAAHRVDIDRERAPELLAVLGCAIGLRTLARGAFSLLPGPGWAYKGGVAYAGTRAIGEAAIAYFESRAVRSGS